MSSSPLAYRYARSILQLATDKGQVEAVREDMLLVSNTLEESRDLVLLLKSPLVKAEKKQLILARVFAGNIGEMTSAFLNIVVRKGRERHLGGVAQAFLNLYDLKNDIVKFTATSAVPLSDETRKKVMDMAQDLNPGMNMELTEKIDTRLIGGMILRLGDQQYDASVARQLQEMRRKFKENPYLPK